MNQQEFEAAAARHNIECTLHVELRLQRDGQGWELDTGYMGEDPLYGTEIEHRECNCAEAANSPDEAAALEQEGRDLAEAANEFAETSLPTAVGLLNRLAAHYGYELTKRTV